MVPDLPSRYVFFVGRRGHQSRRRGRALHATAKQVLVEGHVPQTWSVVAPVRQAERRVSEAHILPAEDVDAVHPRDVAALVQPAREEPPKGLSVEDRLGPRGVIEYRVDGARQLAHSFEMHGKLFIRHCAADWSSP